MSEGTLRPSAPVDGQVSFVVEGTLILHSDLWYHSLPAADVPQVAVLRNLFAEVKLISVECEARQDTLLGASLIAGGHIYVGLVPTGRNASVHVGANAQTVNGVRNKQTFHLATDRQENMIFSFKLDGYETDLAQDPRRNAGVVLWVGNSGIRHSSTANGAKAVGSFTWRLHVSCAGATPLW